MTWKPHVTVAALIERKARFLMVEENVENKICINQPAGHLEAGESLQDAVIRETLEETAWHFQPEHLVGIYRWQQRTTKRVYLRFVFCGICTTQEPGQNLDEGIVRALWLKHDEITARSQQLRSPLVLKCVDDYLAGQRFALEILTDVE